MPDNKKTNILIDANNKINLIIGDFTRNKIPTLKTALLDKKTAAISLGAGILAGILLALLE